MSIKRNIDMVLGITNELKVHDAFLKNKIPKQQDVFLTLTPNACQIDLVTMPKDKNFNYFLCIVNLYNRQLDAEPTATKEPLDILAGFHAILNRGFNKPKYLECDQGGEFNNSAFKRFCEMNNINLIFQSSIRKTQMSIVEYYNGLIEKYLFRKMNLITRQTAYVNRNWVENLPFVINEINKYNTSHYPKYTMQEVINKEPSLLKNEQFFSVGQWVHPKYLKPTNPVTGKIINHDNRFRVGDWKYSPFKKYKISHILVRSGRPIRYMLEGINDTTFTSSELQPAEHSNEIQPYDELNI